MIALTVVNTMNQSMAKKATIFASSGQVVERSPSFSINTLKRKNGDDDE